MAHDSQCGWFYSWTMAIWIPVSLLQKAQIYVQNQPYVIILRIWLLLKLGQELLCVGPDLSRASGSDVLFYPVPVLAVQSERI